MWCSDDIWVSGVSETSNGMRATYMALGILLYALAAVWARFMVVAVGRDGPRKVKSVQHAERGKWQHRD